MFDFLLVTAVYTHIVKRLCMVYNYFFHIYHLQHLFLESEF